MLKPCRQVQVLNQAQVLIRLIQAIRLTLQVQAIPAIQPAGKKANHRLQAIRLIQV